MLSGRGMRFFGIFLISFTLVFFCSLKLGFTFGFDTQNYSGDGVINYTGSLFGTGDGVFLDHLIENEYVRIGCAPDADFSNLAGLYLQDKISGEEAYFLLELRSSTGVIDLSDCGTSNSSANMALIFRTLTTDRITFRVYEDTQGARVFINTITGGAGNTTLRIYKSNKDLTTNNLTFDDLYLPTGAYDADFFSKNNILSDTPQGSVTPSGLTVIKTLNITNGVADNSINVTQIFGRYSYDADVSTAAGIYLNTRPTATATATFYYRYKLEDGSYGPLVAVGSHTIRANPSCQSTQDDSGTLFYNCDASLVSSSCSSIRATIETPLEISVPEPESVAIEFLGQETVSFSGTGSSADVNSLCTQENKVYYTASIINSLQKLTDIRYPYVGGMANSLRFAFYFYDADGNAGGNPQANDYLKINNTEIVFNNERAAGSGDTESSYAYLLFSSNFDRFKADRKAPIFDWAGTNQGGVGNAISPHWATGADMYQFLGRVDIEGNTENTIAFVLGTKSFNSDPVKYGPHDINDDIISAFTEAGGFVSNNQTYNIEYIPRYYYDEEAESEFLKGYSSMILWGTHLDNIVHPCDPTCFSESSEDFFEDSPHSFSATMEDNVNQAIVSGVGVVAANAGSQGIIGIGNQSMPFDQITPSCGGTACSFFVGNTIIVSSNNIGDNVSSFIGTSPEGETGINYREQKQITSYTGTIVTQDVSNFGCGTTIGGAYGTTMLLSGEDTQVISNYRGLWNTITCSGANTISTSKPNLVVKTSITYNGEKYYARIIGFGSLARGGTQTAEGNLIESNARRQLTQLIGYAKKKPIPSINISFADGVVRRPLSAVAGLNATVHDRLTSSAYLIDTFRNLTQENITYVSNGGYLSLSAGNTTGHAIYNATNVTGMILKATLYAWDTSFASENIVYQITRNGKHYYNISKEEPFDFETTAEGIAWTNETATEDLTNSTLLVRIVLQNPTAETPRVYDAYVVYEYRGNPLPFRPAKFWSSYGGEEETGAERIYHDENETHASDSQGAVSHSNANLGDAGGTYKLYVRFVDNRTYNESVYGDGDIFLPYTVDKIGFTVVINNVRKNGFVLSTPEQVNLIGNETLVLHFDKEDENNPSEGETFDNSPFQNHARFSAISHKKLVYFDRDASNGEILSLVGWDGANVRLLGSKSINVNSFNAIGSGDLDDDGHIDIVSVQAPAFPSQTEIIEISTFNGTALLTEGGGDLREGFSTTPTVEGVKVFDINKDGRPDIVTVADTFGNSELRAVNWNGATITPLMNATLGLDISQAELKGISDMDNNGLYDFVMYTRRRTSPFLYNTTIVEYNGSAATVKYSDQYFNSSEPDLVVDMDDDGIDDIVYLNASRFVMAKWNGTDLIASVNISNPCLFGMMGNITGSNLPELGCVTGENVSVYGWNHTSQALTLISTTSFDYAATAVKVIVGGISPGGIDELIISADQINSSYPASLHVYSYEAGTLQRISKINAGQGFQEPAQMHLIDDPFIPSLSKGVFNTSYRFNGRQRIDVPTTAIPENTDITITFWMEKEDGNEDRIIFSSINKTSGCGIKIWLDYLEYVNVQTSAGNSCSSVNVIRSPVSLDGRKMHVAYSGTSQSMKLYLDGSVAASNSLDGRTKRGDVAWIGGTNNQSAFSGFNGSIDEFRIYDRALDSAEVHTIMHFPYSSSKELYGPGDTYDITVVPYYVYEGTNLSASELSSLNISVLNHYSSNDTYALEYDNNSQAMLAQGAVNPDGTVGFLFNSRTVLQANPAIAGKRMLSITARDVDSITSDPAETENITDAFRVALQIKNLTFIEYFGETATDDTFNRGENLTIKTYFYNLNNPGTPFDYGGINFLTYTGKFTSDEAYEVNDNTLASVAEISQSMLGNYSVFSTATEDGAPGYTGDGISSNHNLTVTQNISAFVDSIPYRFFNRGDAFNVSLSFYNNRGERYEEFPEVAINFTYNGVTYWSEGAYTLWTKSDRRFRIPILLSQDDGDVNGTQLNLTTLDTSYLIAQGKMDESCGDFEIVDNETALTIPFWVYGCNTSQTQIWANVTHLAPRKERTYYLYYGNDSLTRTNSFDAIFQKLIPDINTNILLHFDEGGTNTTSADSSGNGNNAMLGNGTVASRPTWTVQDGGRWNSKSDVLFASGSALQFDGVDDVAVVPHTSSLNTSTELTIELWANTSSDTAIKKRPLPDNTKLFMLFDSEDQNNPSINKTRDRSPYGNNGSLYNVTNVTGKYGEGYSFTGFGNNKNSYILINDHNSLALTSNFTIAAWINGNGSKRFTTWTAYDPADDFVDGVLASDLQNGSLYAFVQNAGDGLYLLRIDRNGTTSSIGFLQDLGTSISTIDMKVVNDTIYFVYDLEQATDSVFIGKVYVNGTGYTQSLVTTSSSTEDIQDVAIDVVNDRLFYAFGATRLSTMDIYVHQRNITSWTGMGGGSIFTGTSAGSLQDLQIHNSRVYLLFQNNGNLEIGSVNFTREDFQRAIVYDGTADVNDAKFHLDGANAYFAYVHNNQFRVGKSGIDGSNAQTILADAPDTGFAYSAPDIVTDGTIMYYVALERVGTNSDRVRVGAAYSSNLTQIQNPGSASNFAYSAEAAIVNIHLDGSKLLYAVLGAPQSSTDYSLRMVSHGGNVISKGGHYGIGISADGRVSGFVNSGRSKSFSAAVNSSVVSVSSSLNGGMNHIALISNSTHLNLYINGNVAESKLFGDVVVMSSADLAIGDGFNGTIDDVRIINRSLTNTQVLALMEQYRPDIGNLVDKATYGLYYNNTNSRVYGWIENMSNTVSMFVAPNQWNHIGFTYDGTTANIYLNGAQVDSSAISRPLSTSYNDLFVGGFGGLKGHIDELKISNRAYIQGEIEADAERRKYISNEPSISSGAEQRQVLVNGTGHVVLDTVVPTTAVDTYASLTSNNTLEELDYVIRSMIYNNTGDSSPAIDVDSNYYLGSDRILFQSVMRGDTQRVNASFVDVKNLSVRDGTNASVGWYNPDSLLVYSQYMTTTSGNTSNFDQQLSSSDVAGMWQINYTINGSTPENYQNSLGVPEYSLYEIPFTISSTGTQISDYPVKILITNQTILSHIQSDGRDIRFFNHSESEPYATFTGEIPYWIETLTPTQLIAWINLTIPAVGGKTIYMYYGNPGASHRSDVDEIFEVYDVSTKSCDSSTATAACTYNLSANDVGVHLKAVVVPTCEENCSQYIFMGNTTVSVGSTETGNVVQTGFQNGEGFSNCHDGACWETPLFSYIPETQYTLDIYAPRTTNTTFQIVKDGSTTFSDLNYTKLSSTQGAIKSVWFRESIDSEILYEVPINVSGTGTALTNYPASVVITDSAIIGHIQSDGRDIRFFNQSESDPYQSTNGNLSYYIESISSSKINVTVRVGTVPASGSTTIYMYYGNSSASSTQSSSLMKYELYEDFSSGISPALWNNTGVITSAGVAVFDSNTDTLNTTRFKGTRGHEWTWRQRYSAIGNHRLSFALVRNGSGTQYYNDIRIDLPSEHAFSGPGGSFTYNPQYPENTAFHTIKIRINETGFAQGFIDGSSVGSTNVGDLTNPTHMRFVYGLFACSGCSAELDDISIVKYVDNKPVVTIGSERRITGSSGYTVKDVIIRRYTYPEPSAVQGAEKSLFSINPYGISTFLLNTTITSSQIDINVLGESNTQKKIFNLNEILDISGTLFHSDGGPFRIKSPSGNSTRNITIQLFNTSYGVDILENQSVSIDAATGTFQINRTLNGTLNDTYHSPLANQTDINGFNYGLRFYDGTTNVSSNTQGNDGNLTEQFDIDYNYYPAISRTDGFDIYNRGEVVNMQCISYGARNNTVSGATTYFRAYNPSNVVWFNDGNSFISNGSGIAQHLFVLNSTSPVGDDWQVYCNTTRDGNTGSARDANFTVSNVVNATLWINDANESAYLNADFNTGHTLDSVYAYAEVRNARGELTNQFDNLSVEHWYRNPFTLATSAQFNRTLVVSNTGIYTNVSNLASYQYQTYNTTFSFTSNDSNGNTEISGTSIRYGKAHFLATNISVNDTHILRNQTLLYTVKGYDTYDDMQDDGIINASSGLIPSSVSYDISVYTDTDHITPEYTYSISGSSETTQAQYYGPAAIRDFRDVRIRATSSTLDLDGIVWNRINRTSEPPLGDMQGLFAVDDLLIAAIGFDKQIYSPPQIVTAMIKFSYFLSSFSSIVPANEPYDLIRAVLKEPDNETSHVGTYYNISSVNATQTDGNGNVTFSFNLSSIAEAGKNWKLNIATNSENETGFFDVQLVVNNSRYFAHLNSEDTNPLVESIYHNRNELVQANFTFANNPESKSLTTPQLYDVADDVYLNTSGTLLGTQGAEFVWRWPIAATAENTLNGTQHALEIQTTLNDLETNATASVHPNLSSLLLLDVHTQISSTLAKDADPTTDGGNLRDDPDLKERTEDTTFIIGNDILHFWTHAQNIRGENINTSVNSTTLTWTDPLNVLTEQFNATSDQSAWSEMQSITPESPSGIWNLFGLLQWSGNSANDTQTVIIGKLRDSALTVKCGQRASTTGILCTVTAILQDGNGTAEGQILRYRIRNESLDLMVEDIADEIGSGVYTFSFVPPAAGNYLIHAYVRITGSRIYADTTTLYADALGLTEGQSDALTNTDAELSQINETISLPQNFGENNLTSIRTQLEELRTQLLEIREEGSEDPILVTDAIVSVNGLISKSERGELSETQLRQETAAILSSLTQASEANRTNLAENKKGMSWQFALIVGLSVASIIALLKYRRMRRNYF